MASTIFWADLWAIDLKRYAYTAIVVISNFQKGIIIFASVLVPVSFTS